MSTKLAKQHNEVRKVLAHHGHQHVHTALVADLIAALTEKQDKEIEELRAKLKETEAMAWEVGHLKRDLDEWKVPDRDSEDLWTLLGRVRWLKESLEKVPTNEHVVAAWAKVVNRSGITILQGKKYLMLDEESCIALGATMEAIGWVHKEGEDG